MRHILLAFFVLVLTIVGGAVLYSAIAPLVKGGDCHALPLSSLIFSGVAILLAIGLAVPTNLKAAVEAAGEIPAKLKDLKGGAS